MKNIISAIKKQIKEVEERSISCSEDQCEIYGELNGLEFALELLENHLFKDLQVSKSSSQKLKGTCTHLTRLIKNDVPYLGIHNGLSYWGIVEDGLGNEVEKLQTEYEEPYQNQDGEWQTGYMPNFSERDFEFHGYEIIN